jgi:hypothetical protein
MSNAGAAQEYRDIGFALVPDLIPEPQLARLRDEAFRLRPVAETRLRDGFQLTPDGRVLGPAQSLAAIGDDLKDIQYGKELISRLERLTEQKLDPSRACYYYYRRGDFVALHRDLPFCPTIALVWLAGPAGPLRVHPELVDHDDAKELLSRARTSNGHLSGGVDIDVRQGPVVLAGNKIPHSRPPHPYEEELVMAAVSFDDLSY